MAKRIKQTGPALKTRADVEEVVRQIREATLKRDELVLQKDGFIQDVEERYARELAKIADQLDGLMALCQAWAEANKTEFGGAKSIDLQHGTLGFRTGMPTLKTLGGWTWARVMQAIKDLNFRDLIRTKEEVNKEQILTELARLNSTALPEIGVKVVQAESFFVDPKREPIETARQTA